MKIIDSGPDTGENNMRKDLELLKSDRPVLRLYQWSPPCISLGKAQDMDEIDRSFCKENRIDIVRRPTGGKAVLHEKELTYCIVVDEKLMPWSILEAYLKISRPLIKALRKLGIIAQTNERPKDTKNPNCFLEPSYHEILVNDKKIIGSAQLRRGGKVLQHGSILIDVDYEKMAGCFHLKTNISHRTTCINEIVNKSLPDIKQAVLESFLAEFGNLKI